MALTDIYKIHSIVLLNETEVATPLHATHSYIFGITNVSMPVNATVNKQVTAGNVFATTGAISFSTVDLQFTSTLAKDMLDLVGMSGLCVAPGAGAFDVYVAKYDCAGPVAGSVHRRYRISKGMLYLTQAQCDHQGDLTVSAQMQAVYDGTTNPVTVVETVALPTLTTPTVAIDLTDAWTLSTPADNTVHSVNIGQKRSVSIDFGTNTSTQGADSDAFDSFSSIDSVLPVLTVNGVNPLWFDTAGAGDSLTIGINGKLATHANTAIAFRKRDGAGGFVLDATAEHITVTAYGPTYFDNLLSGSGTDAVTTSFRLEAIYDGTNAPLVWNTATAI